MEGQSPTNEENSATDELIKKNPEFEDDNITVVAIQGNPSDIEEKIDIQEFSESIITQAIQNLNNNSPKTESRPLSVSKVSQEQVKRLRSFFEDSLKLKNDGHTLRNQSPSLKNLKSVSNLLQKFESHELEPQDNMATTVSITGNTAHITKKPRIKSIKVDNNSRDNQIVPNYPRYYSLINKPASPMVSVSIPEKYEQKTSSPKVPKPRAYSPEIFRSSSLSYQPSGYKPLRIVNAEEDYETINLRPATFPSYQLEVDEKDLMDIPDGFYVRTGQVYERIDEGRFASRRSLGHWITTIFSPGSRSYQNSDMSTTEVTNIWSVKNPLSPRMYSCNCNCKAIESKTKTMSPKRSALRHSVTELSSKERSPIGSPILWGLNHSPAPYRTRSLSKWDDKPINYRNDWTTSSLRRSRPEKRSRSQGRKPTRSVSFYERNLTKESRDRSPSPLFLTPDEIEDRIKQLKRENSLTVKPEDPNESKMYPHHTDDARIEWVEMAKRIGQCHMSCSTHISPMKKNREEVLTRWESSCDSAFRPRSLESIKIEPISLNDSGIDNTPISTDIDSKRAFFDQAFKKQITADKSNTWTHVQFRQ